MFSETSFFAGDPAEAYPELTLDLPPSPGKSASVKGDTGDPAEKSNFSALARGALCDAIEGELSDAEAFFCSICTGPFPFFIACAEFTFAVLGESCSL